MNSMWRVKNEHGSEFVCDLYWAMQREEQKER